MRIRGLLAPALLGAVLFPLHGTIAAQDDPARLAKPAPPPAESSGSKFELLEVSLDLLVSVGSSTERDPVLQQLQGGAHDPRTRGFTLQQAEFGIAGALQPWFRAEAYLIASIDPVEGETITELEEAFLTSTCLPGGLELEVGQMFTEFGLLNPRHPDAWHWVDQPFVHTRLFGGDGMRAPGARLQWTVPGAPATQLHVGVQNARGETMTSFFANDEVYDERPIGGRAFVEQDVRSFNDLVYLGRAATGFELSTETELQLGASVLFGPNATGSDGDTTVFGVDLGWHWRPADAEHGWPFVSFEAELLARRFRADAQIDGNDPNDPNDDVLVPRDTLTDWGGYAQGLWGFQRHWEAGLRVEWGTGSGANYDAGADSLVGTSTDPYRADRVRISPLLVWHATEAARVRLQYNYDDADFLDDNAHSVWLAFEVSLGQHASHGHEH